MAPPGRPAHVRNVYSFEDLTSPPPSDVVLDTSFLVNAFVESERLHTACETYLDTLVAAETTVYYNAITEVELAEVAFRIAIKERHGDRRGARNDRRITARVGRLAEELLAAWELTLSTLTHARIEIGEVAGDYLPLMTKYGLSSMDAVHAATALFVEAEGLVTTDAGFGNVPASDLRLFVDSSRVTSAAVAVAARRHQQGSPCAALGSH